MNPPPDPLPRADDPDAPAAWPPDLAREYRRVTQASGRTVAAEPEEPEDAKVGRVVRALKALARAGPSALWAIVALGVLATIWRYLPPITYAEGGDAKPAAPAVVVTDPAVLSRLDAIEAALKAAQADVAKVKDDVGQLRVDAAIHREAQAGLKDSMSRLLDHFLGPTPRAPR